MVKKPANQEHTGPRERTAPTGPENKTKTHEPAAPTARPTVTTGHAVSGRLCAGSPLGLICFPCTPRGEAEAVTVKLGRGACWLKIRRRLQVVAGGTRLPHVLARPMLPGWWRPARLDPQRAGWPSLRSAQRRSSPGKASPLCGGLLFAEAGVLALSLAALETRDPVTATADP